jgi:hypothetical protein
MTGTRQTPPGGRHRVGAAAPPRAERPLRSSRTGRALLAGGLAVATATGGVLVAQTASAAVPSFPDNVVVFPDRDFVTIEGYQDHVGQTALVEVTRPGVGVIGSAQGKVEAGDVAFEINHPGGYCWGAGTSLAVTPDIQPKDVVSITFPDGVTGETTTAGAMVTADPTLSGNTVTVTGVLGGAIPAQLEQRIVNPDLVPDIGKRDIRATDATLTPAPKGGYSSSLAVSGDTFTATYVFEDAAVAEKAANSDLGERAMSWQVEDADANRQGLTIAEFGEAGGPGMGGCPNGPTGVPGAQGSMGVAKSGSTMTVKWTPAVAPNGTAAVTGYQVDAIDNASGAIIGSRTAATANQAVLTVGATANYTVEVRSLTGTKLSEPFPTGSGTTTPPAGSTDDTQPTLTLTPAATTGVLRTATIAAKSSEAGEVYYTTGTDAVITGGLPTDAAQLYTTPLAVTGPTTYNFVTIDGAGNVSDEVTQAVDVPAASTTAPASAPTGIVATGGQLQAEVRWLPVTGATAYQVTVYQQQGTAFAKVDTQPAPGQSPMKVTGLTAGKYAFTVTALNGTAAGPESTPQVQADVTGVVASLTVARAQWKAGDFRVEGTTSLPVGTAITLTGTVNGATATTQIAVTAGAVAGGPNDYRFRVKTGPMGTTRPTNVSVSAPGANPVNNITLG